MRRRSVFLRICVYVYVSADMNTYACAGIYVLLRYQRLSGQARKNEALKIRSWNMSRKHLITSQIFSLQCADLEIPKLHSEDLGLRNSAQNLKFHSLFPKASNFIFQKYRFNIVSVDRPTPFCKFIHDKLGFNEKTLSRDSTMEPSSLVNHTGLQVLLRQPNSEHSHDPDDSRFIRSVDSYKKKIIRLPVEHCSDEV